MRDRSRDYYEDNYIDGRYPSVKAPAQDPWDDEFWDDDVDAWERKGAAVVRGGTDRIEMQDPQDAREERNVRRDTGRIAGWGAAYPNRELEPYGADRGRRVRSRAYENEDRQRRKGVEVRGGLSAEDYYSDDVGDDVSSWEVNRYLRTLPQRETTKRSVRSLEEAPAFEDGARAWRDEPISRLREQERQAQEEAVVMEGPAMPLTVVLLTTALLLSVIAGVGKFRGYRDVDWNWKRMPLLSVVFSGWHDDISPITALLQDPAAETVTTADDTAADGTGEDADQTGDGSDAVAAGTEETPAEVELNIPDGVNEEVVQAVDYGVCDSYYLAPAGTTFERQTTGIYAPNGTYLTPQSVDARYFADALLIGDSRTDGLHLYSGMAEDAHFWCKEALTVYDIFDETAVYYAPGDMDGAEMSLEEVLGVSTFRKVYVCIGINEVGTANTVQFYNQYMELISYIRERQPDALIYIQGIMHVSASYSQTNAALNNTNVVEKNTAIASLANGRDIFYLDMNDAVCDENGDLLADLSNDGLHLKASAYQLWKEDLLGHAFVRDDADWTAPEVEAPAVSGDGSNAGTGGQGTGKPESDISEETGLIVQ